MSTGIALQDSSKREDGERNSIRPSMIRPPRVGFVGGHARVEREIRAFGAQMGLEVEVHDGHTKGGGAARLVALVHRNDLVVIVTGTNSHNAVHVAKRELAKSAARLLILKACGARTARAILEEIAQAAA